MHILTQDSKNSCGKAIIQQYMLYTGIQDEQNQQKVYRFPSWGTTPMMIRKVFTITTKRKRKRQTHLSTENIQEYITIYKTPFPVLGLVRSAKNPHNNLDKKSPLHGLHYYLLIGYDADGFIVYNPFGYEETISYTQRSYLFAFTSHPQVVRKRYEKMLYRLRIIQPNMLLLPHE